MLESWIYRIMFGDTSGVPTRRNELTKLYADECVKVAEEAGVRVLNLWSIFQHEAPDWGEKYLRWGWWHSFAWATNAEFIQRILITPQVKFAPDLENYNRDLSICIHGSCPDDRTVFVTNRNLKVLQTEHDTRRIDLQFRVAQRMIVSTRVEN